MTELEIATRLAVAGLAGMAVGLEREWSGHATGPLARFAGVRTFLLLGAIGGVTGWLVETGIPVVAAALLLGATGLVVAAYLTAARRAPEAIDGTTETAAVLVLGIGLLAGLGHLRVSSGSAAVVVLALAEKESIRGFVHRIGDHEMRAALQFAVLALVVLPLLPEGPFGPGGSIRPRSLWIVVLLISGLNFAGYIARKVLGEHRGYQAMGALGGLVSSTAVTLTFARKSRAEPGNAVPLAVGTVAASTVLVPRLLGITLLLNAGFVGPAAVGLLPMLLAGVLLLLVGFRRLADGTPESPPPAPENPLQLWSAIKMAAAFQAVLLLLELATRRFGSAGIIASAGVLGLTDTDALTYGMNRLAESPDLVATAARALALGVVVNTLFKSAIAAALGSPAFRRLALPGLLAMAVAGGIGFWVLGRVGFGV